VEKLAMKAIKYKIRDLEIFEISKEELDHIETNATKEVHSSISSLVITLTVSIIISLLDNSSFSYGELLVKLCIIICTSILAIFGFKLFMEIARMKKIIGTIDKVKNRKPVDNTI
jgi:Na+/melibiose symporter-like transporter